MSLESRIFLRPKLIEMFLPTAKNCNEISGLPRCISPGCHVSDQTVLMLSIDSREGISGKTTNLPDLTTWHSLQPETEYAQKPTIQNLNWHLQECDRQEDAQALATLSCKPQQAWWTPSFSFFESKKQDPKWNYKTASREGHEMLLH